MERKSWDQIKAEKAAKREAKGKPPIKSLAEVREDYNAERAAMKERKRARKLAQHVPPRPDEAIR